MYFQDRFWTDLNRFGFDLGRRTPTAAKRITACLFSASHKKGPLLQIWGPFFCKQQLGYCLAPDKPKDDHPTSLVRKIWTPSKKERKQENFRFRSAITSKTARETPSTKLCKHGSPNGGRRCLAVGDCNNNNGNNTNNTNNNENYETINNHNNNHEADVILPDFLARFYMF